MSPDLYGDKRGDFEHVPLRLLFIMFPCYLNYYHIPSGKKAAGVGAGRKA